MYASKATIVQLDRCTKTGSAGASLHSYYWQATERWFSTWTLFGVADPVTLEVTPLNKCVRRRGGWGRKGESWLEELTVTPEETETCLLPGQVPNPTDTSNRAEGVQVTKLRVQEG